MFQTPNDSVYMRKTLIDSICSSVAVGLTSHLSQASHDANFTRRSPIIVDTTPTLRLLNGKELISKEIKSMKLKHSDLAKVNGPEFKKSYQRRLVFK